MPWYEWYPSTGVGIIVPTMLGDVAVTGAVGIYRDSELLHTQPKSFCLSFGVGTNWSMTLLRDVLIPRFGPFPSFFVPFWV